MAPLSMPSGMRNSEMLLLTPINNCLQKFATTSSNKYACLQMCVKETFYPPPGSVPMCPKYKLPDYYMKLAFWTHLIYMYKCT